MSRVDGKAATDWVSETIALTFRYVLAVFIAFLLSVFILIAGSVLFDIGFAPLLIDTNLEK